MKKWSIVFPLFCGIVFFSGCRTLPPGEPPEGAIVARQTTGRTLSLAAAEEQLKTALLMIVMAELPPGQAIAIEAPENLRKVLSRVIQECAKYCRCRIGGTTSRWVVSGKSAPGLWQFQLTDQLNRKILWQQSFQLQERP